MHIGKAHEKHGQPQGLWDNYLYALPPSKAVGLANLAADDKVSLYAAAKLLGIMPSRRTRSTSPWRPTSSTASTKKPAAKPQAPSPNSLNAAPKAADAAGKQADYQDSLFGALNCSEHAMSYSRFTADEDLRPQGPLHGQHHPEELTPLGKRASLVRRNTA